MADGELVIEYRKIPATFEWHRSAMPWTDADIKFFNRVVGYEKYRARVKVA